METEFEKRFNLTPQEFYILGVRLKFTSSNKNTTKDRADICRLLCDGKISEAELISEQLTKGAIICSLENLYMFETPIVFMDKGEYESFVKTGKSLCEKLTPYCGTIIKFYPNCNITLC